MAFTCTATGTGYELDACDLGCGGTPAPHCKYLQPKYLPDICDVGATVDTLSIASSGMLDPNVDTTCTGGVVGQGGAALCIVRAGTIDISSSLVIVGSTEMNGRAIAFVADDDLTVSGTIDVGGHRGMNGPAGGTFLSGGAVGLNTQTALATGGGGAGGATQGGAGATGQSGTGMDGGGANGGAIVMNPALLASFVGGASSYRLDPDPYFGGGGGALMLVSCRGTVSVQGMLNASGGGGAGGFINILPFAGRGGGAGGNVVLQGRHVTVTGEVYANGGGGGEGWNGSSAGVDGRAGTTSDAAGANGGNGINNAGDGGTGGWIGLVATSGKHPTDSQSGPGGGGGSVGFLQIYTPSGVAPTLTPSHVSPAFQPNANVELR